MYVVVLLTTDRMIQILSGVKKSKTGIASLAAQTEKNLPAMQETQVQFLGWEGPLEKGMATHSSILAWRIPRTEEPGGLQFIGLQRVGHDWATNTFTFYEVRLIW